MLFLFLNVLTLRVCNDFELSGVLAPSIVDFFSSEE